MSFSSDQILNRLEPLRSKKENLLRLDKDTAWNLVYHWVKTDCVTQSEFRKLSYYLTYIWSK